MEKSIDFYKQCIKKLLSEYESLETEHSKVALLFDDEHSHYMAVRFGWFGQKRIHLCLAHISLEDDIVVLQCNNTEDLIATELVKRGIPKEKIRLSFLPSGVQMFSEWPLAQGEFEPA
jgi:hypothetical protein